MWQSWTPSRLQADMLALQVSAERAGCALGCPFSSSDEFEAAVIRTRLDAGIYGPKRRRRYALYAGTAMSALAVLACMI
jgi:hypothetical protein